MSKRIPIRVGAAGGAIGRVRAVPLVGAICTFALACASSTGEHPESSEPDRSAEEAGGIASRALQPDPPSEPAAGDNALGQPPLDVGQANHGQGIVARPQSELRGRRMSWTAEELEYMRALKAESDAEFDPPVPSEAVPLGQPNALADEDDGAFGDTLAPARPASAGAWREGLAKAAQGEPPDASVPVMLVLPDQPFPWHEFHEFDLSESERLARVRVREQQLAPALDALEQRLVGVGVRDVARFWIIPAIHAVVPAKALPEIAKWNELEQASRDDRRTVTYEEAYKPGLEGREQMMNNRFIDAGYTGVQGGAYTSARVRVGIFDSLEFGADHPGFKRADGTSRIIKRLNCENGTCVNYTPSSDGHGTGVAGVAIGSIEAGQDPSQTAFTARLIRSGMSPQSDFYYYSGGMTNVVQQSVLDKIDVLNYSFNPGLCSPCDATCDDNGYNAALRNSTGAGTLHVFSGGNTFNPDLSCTVNWPKMRREVLAIGGLATQNMATAYGDTTIYSSSSRGGMDVTIHGVTYSRRASLIDFVAPACYERMYYMGGSKYGGLACGTSFAAPSVTGSAALVKNALYSLGQGNFHPRMLQAYLIMLADGWAYEAGGARTVSGMDFRSGAGRLRNHFMSGLTAPWAWGCHRYELHTGETVAYPVGGTGPESSSIKTWKLGLTWVDNNLTDVSDVDVYVYNTCPAGGGAPVQVASDISRDLRARLRLEAANIGGKCLEYRIYGYWMSGDLAHTIFACDYYQSNATGH